MGETMTHLPGWLAFWLLWWHAIAVAVPVVAGPIKPAVQPMSCPSIVVTHGIGRDLKTWAKARDLCSEYQR